MVVRIWHGWTTAEDAETYERLVNGTIVPGIMARRLPGLRQVDILRRQDKPGEDVEFVTVMRFDDWAAVEEFAGPGGTMSVVPAEARRVLDRFDEHSQHYGLVGTHLAAS